jgi:DNA-binding FrmR family transcriptional regulator
MAKKLTEHFDDLPEERKAIINRLRRIEGQLRGIQRMIIEEKPCVEVLTQLSAARNAMQQACVEIIKKNMYKCIRESTNTDKNIEELEKLVSALINLAPSTNL